MTRAILIASADVSCFVLPDMRSGFCLPTHWLIIAPFIIFAMMLLILSTLYLVICSL